MDLQQMRTRDQILALQDELPGDDWKVVRLMTGSLPRRLLHSFVFTARGELWPIDHWAGAGVMRFDEDPSGNEGFLWPVMIFPAEAVSDADFLDFMLRDDCANLKMRMSLLPVAEQGMVACRTSISKELLASGGYYKGWGAAK